MKMGKSFNRKSLMRSKSIFSDGSVELSRFQSSILRKKSIGDRTTESVFLKSFISNANISSTSMTFYQALALSR